MSLVVFGPWKKKVKLNKNLGFQKPKGSFSSQFPENLHCLELEIYMLSIIN
jgi:hypothetical protein